VSLASVSVPVPRLEAPATLSVPAAIVVAKVDPLLVPDSINVPLPFLVNVCALPLTVPLSATV